MKFKVADGMYNINWGRGGNWKKNLDEVKTSVFGRKFDKKQALWTAPLCARNNFIAKLYSGQNPYAPFDKDPGTDEAIERALSFTKENVPQFTRELYEWQPLMLSSIYTHKKTIIAADTRMGKTLPVLLAIMALGIKKAWFVTNKSAKEGIRREMKKWGFKGSLYLMTYHEMVRLIESDPLLVPNFVCLDEAHYIKTPKSARGKAARALAEFQTAKYGDDCYRILLSGTPAPNKPMDWHNLTETAQPGFLRESSYALLYNTLAHLEFIDGQYGSKYPALDKKKGNGGWKPEELEKLGKRMKGLVYKFTNSEWNSRYIAPTEEFVNLPVDKRIKQGIQLVRRLKKGAELKQFLRQISDGFNYEKGDIDIVTLKQEKLTNVHTTLKDQQFLRDLKEFETVGRLAVFAAFRYSVDKLVDLATQNGWEVLRIDGRGKVPINSTLTLDEMLDEMDATTNKWRAKKLIAIHQADSGTEGMEYSTVPVEIFYSLSDKFASFMQAKGRITSNNNPHKNKAWRFYHFMSIDKLMYDQMDNKGSIQAITDKEIQTGLDTDMGKSENFDQDGLNYSDMEVTL